VEKGAAAIGVFGYIILVIGYIVAATYLSPKKRLAFHALFGFLTLFIVIGVVLRGMGVMSGPRVVQVVLLSMGVTGALMIALFFYYQKKGGIPGLSIGTSPKPSGSLGLSKAVSHLPIQTSRNGDAESDETLSETIGSLDTIFSEGYSVLLYGPTGSGKTFGIVFEHLKRLEAEGKLDGLVLIPCTDGMEDYDLLSKPIPVGPEEKVRMLLSLSDRFPEVDVASISRTLGDWTRVEGPLKAAFRRAAAGERLAVVFDELNRASRSARNLVLKAIDPVLGHYELHDFTSGEVLTVPIGGLQFCATCNLGASYSQTHDLDESLLDRFQSVLFVDYSTGLERRILAAEGVPPEVGERLVRVASALREAYKMGHLAAPLSTRHLKNWGRAIARGADPVGSARNLWVDRLIAHDRHGYPDPDQIHAILEILALNFKTEASPSSNGTPKDEAAAAAARRASHEDRP
jgi:MoxR-like ATPase